MIDNGEAVEYIFGEIRDGQRMGWSAAEISKFRLRGLLSESEVQVRLDDLAEIRANRLGIISA